MTEGAAPRRRFARALAVGAALLGLAWAAPAAAAGDPDLSWWTLETDHFRVHYEASLEPVARRVAAVAETAHDELRVSLGYAPSTLTEIVLTDDTDSANGSATALPLNTIRLFVTAPDDMSPLGDYDDWYLELVTHEYTHILHTDNISGIPAVVNRLLGKTIAPNQIQPRWVLEGLAVVKESEHTGGGRIRSSLFRAYLRADVLADHLATLDQVSNGAKRWPQGNLYYLYGSHFLAWISRVYGPGTMSAVAADYGASLVPWGINRAIRRVTGRTYEELYQGWVAELRETTRREMAEVDARGLREGTRLTFHGQDVSSPRFVPAELRARPGVDELVYSRNDLDARAGLYRVSLAPPAEGQRRDETLWARAGDAMPAFGAHGELYFTARRPFRRVYDFNDLVVLPKGVTAPEGDEPERRLLTEGERATALDVSPDGRQLAYVRNARGTTTLMLADVQPDGSLAHRRELVHGARFDQAYTPRFSPDGKRLAYSAWTAGGYRDLRVVDLATGAWRALWHDRATDLQPVWSPDGARLYFASDRTGIYNIYAYEMSTGHLAQVTNVRTGAFQPAISADERTLAYVGYTTDGYDLYTMPLDPARWLDALPSADDRPDPPVVATVPMRKVPYAPLRTLRPYRYSFEYKPGAYGDNALTVKTDGADVVGHHGFSASITVDGKAPTPAFNVDYVYGRLPADLTMRVFHGASPRGGYRLGDVSLPYDELITGVTTGLSYATPREFSAHGFGLSYSAYAFHGELTQPLEAFDPYAARPARPPQGVLGSVHLGYGFSNAEGSLETVGAVRGGSFNVAMDYADKATASKYTLRAFSYGAAAYVPLPYLHHVLALRSAGGISSGNYTRSGFYFVGGYDADNTSLSDQITTGALDAAFVLRGYPPGSYVGRKFLLETLEYRAPLLVVDRGPSTLPFFLRRLDGALFVDHGGAFNALDFRAIDLFHDGNVIDSPSLHTSVGAELWVSLGLGYYLTSQLRLGYARGFSREAYDGGKWYLVASGAF